MKRGQTIRSLGILGLALLTGSFVSAQVTVQGSTIVTGGGSTGNNLATYSHPGNIAGGLCFVSPYTISSDAFAAINACIAQLPAAGGTIDATALGTANYTVITPLTALNTAGAKVTLLKNPATTFTLNQVFASPTDSPASCAVPVGQGSAIVDAGGVGVNSPNFLVGSAFVGWDVVCNGDFSGAQNDMRINGVNVQGNSAATVRGALMHFQGLFNGTPSIENSSTSNCAAQCLELDSSTTSAGQGNLTFINDQFTDGATSGTYPGSVVNIDALTSAGGLGNITFLGGSIKFNGPHNQLLTINGRGGAQTNTIAFFNTGFVTAAASTSVSNPNVDPIQIIDAAQIYFSSLSIEGFINSAAQANAVDISATVANQNFGISIASMKVYTAAGFTRLINNTVEGTDETGYANGNGDTILPPYNYGQVAPQIRQTNSTPPSTTGVCALGSLWVNSAAASISTMVNVCAGTPGSQTYQPIGTGGGGGSGTVNNAVANQLGEYPAAGNTIGGAPSLYALTPSMTQAQINTLFSSLSGQNSVIIPAGTPQALYATNGQIPYDLRLGANYFQMPGAACDGRQSALTIQITSGSNTSNVGSLLSAADIGKTFFFFARTGYAYGSTQSLWTAKLSGYTYPNATWSANAPFSSNTQVFYGTDNLAGIETAMTQASAVFPLTIPTGCLLLVNGTIPWNNNQVIVGRHLNAGGFAGRPGADVIASTDTSGQSVSGAGTGLGDMKFVVGTEIDWTLGYNLYAADGTLTVVPPVYRPLLDHTSNAVHPLAPGWLTGGKNGVAKITQNSAVVCTPNSETPPAVGQQFMLPYHTNIFTSVVDSTAGSGSCPGGTTARTLHVALPNTTDFTSAQDEWFTGSAIQSTTTTIPTTITYPLTLTVTLSTNPVPGWPSNFPQTGHVKVCGIEADYGGATATTMTLRKGPATSAGCTGTTPIAPMNPCAAKNLFGSTSDQPWPVIPSINAGDSTPSGANWFPGACGGNFAVAFPTANGNVYAGGGLVGGFLENLNFQGSAGIYTGSGTSTGNANNAGGVYMAGNAMPFGSHFENLIGQNLQYDFVQGPASSGQHGVAAVGPTGFGNTINNLWFFGAMPLAFVDMQNTDVGEINLNSTEISPFDNTAVGSGTCLQVGFTLDEQTGGVVTSTQYDQFHPYGCEPENGSHAWVKPAVDIRGTHITFDTANFEGIPSVFGGDHLKITNGNLHLPSINYGSNNDFGTLDVAENAYATNVWNGTQQFYDWGSNTTGSRLLGGNGPPTALGPGTVQGYQGRDISPSVTGSKAYYALGGMITPWQWDCNGMFDTNPFTACASSDPTAHMWGASSQCALGGAALCHTNHFSQSVSGFIYIGAFDQLYDGPYVLDGTFKSVSAGSSFLLTIRAADSGSGTCSSVGTVAAIPVTTTTSYTATKAAVDMTGHAGCILDVTYGSGSTTDTILTDRFNFVPQPQQVLLPTATPTPGAACAGPNAIIGSDSAIPYYCLNNVVVGGGGGTSGLTALTGDVIATGTGSVAASVKTFGGGTLFSSFTGLVQNTAGVASQATTFNLSGSGRVGTFFAAGLDTMASSATPVINAALGNTHYNTLTANVTSSSFSGGVDNQPVMVKICQDGTGGRTWFWPSNFAGFPAVTQAANGCTTAIGWYDLTANTVWGDQYNAASCVSNASSNVPCGAATKGYFAIPAGTNSTLTILTSAVLAGSGFAIESTPGAGSLLSVTCNTIPVIHGVTTWTPGTSFTVEAVGTTTNPACFSWSLINP